jgi:hypothetical protein
VSAWYFACTAVDCADPPCATVPPQQQGCGPVPFPEEDGWTIVLNRKHGKKVVMVTAMTVMVIGMMMIRMTIRMTMIRMTIRTMMTVMMMIRRMMMIHTMMMMMMMMMMMVVVV